MKIAMAEACLEIIGIEERLGALLRGGRRNRAEINRLKKRRRQLTGRIGEHTDRVLGC